MRQLIINLDDQNNLSKETEILAMLKKMDIDYYTTERQTVEEYNKELEDAEAEIEKGNFTSADDLKKEAGSW